MTPDRNNMQELFEKAVRDDREIFENQISLFTSESIEYGKIIYRNLFLFSGGGLLLVPTLFSNITAIPPSLLLSSAKCFIFGLVFASASIYLAHINFQYIIRSLETQRGARHRYYQAVFIKGDDTVLPPSDHGAASKFISLTFVFSHAFGLLSLFAIIFGAWSIAGANI
ncbi:hypothetical protein [Pararhodobacter zhoushanensis]|uniref:Uncharacterized protein n=1 Tax=Pararhodobacter zhoushanensis TaxID=2479545 RepID=A0ABT3H0G9_9RHOB|nr:hypothetical protein [Pararhodobacter zhoushanensis]MCW1933329.1 hypothetical protein [Pararhodobacter zhoushanensis]